MEENLKGIYAIIVREKYAYVGQSVNLLGRIEDHLKKMVNNDHPNFKNINYTMNDVEYKILEYTNDNYNLNDLEKKWYDNYSDLYIMMNLRPCGEQSINGRMYKFYKNMNFSYETYMNNIYIGDKIITSEDGLLCLSDAINYIKENSDYDFRCERVFRTDIFKDRVRALYNINNSNESIVVQMKKKKIYKTIGARDNKKIYCSFGILFTTFFGCKIPQISSSALMLISDYGYNIKNNYIY